MRAHAGLTWLAALASVIAVGSSAGTPAQPVTLGGLDNAAWQDTAGHPFRLASLAGQPLILNFWARWCLPCREEMPLLSAAQQGHPAVRIVGLAPDDEPSAVADFARAYAPAYTVLVSAEPAVDALAAAGDPEATLPYTLAFDAGGHLVYSHRGALERAGLEDLLRSLVP